MHPNIFATHLIHTTLAFMFLDACLIFFPFYFSQTFSLHFPYFQIFLAFLFILNVPLFLFTFPYSSQIHLHLDASKHVSSKLYQCLRTHLSQIYSCSLLSKSSKQSRNQLIILSPNLPKMAVSNSKQCFIFETMFQKKQIFKYRLSK